MPRGPRIGPRVADERKYLADLRRLILGPLRAEVGLRVAAAGESYAAIGQAIGPVRDAINNLPADVDDTVRANLTAQMDGHKRRFARSMRRHLGVAVDLLTDTPIDLDARIAENVALIKTIAPRFHDGLAARLGDLARSEPFDQEQLRAVLAREFKSTGYNLRRLTRDQTSKLTGQLNRARQTEVGVERYEWVTAGDDRVRNTHAANSGEIFSWGSPPDTGPPGEEIMCRCVAVPVLTSVRARPDERTGGSVPVGVSPPARRVPPPRVPRAPRESAEGATRAAARPVRPGDDGWQGLSGPDDPFFDVAAMNNKRFAETLDAQIIGSEFNAGVGGSSIADDVARGLNNELRGELAHVLGWMGDRFPLARWNVRETKMVKGRRNVNATALNGAPPAAVRDAASHGNWAFAQAGDISISSAMRRTKPDWMTEAMNRRWYRDEMGKGRFEVGQRGTRYGADWGIEDDRVRRMGTMVHEFGHHVAYTAAKRWRTADVGLGDWPLARREAMQIRFDAMVRRRGLSDDAAAWSNVSDYAATNIDEFSAESFTAVTFYGDEAPLVARLWVREMADTLDGMVDETRAAMARARAAEVSREVSPRKAELETAARARLAPIQRAQPAAREAAEATATADLVLPSSRMDEPEFRAWLRQSPRTHREAKLPDTMHIGSDARREAIAARVEGRDAVFSADTRRAIDEFDQTAVTVDIADDAPLIRTFNIAHDDPLWAKIEPDVGGSYTVDLPESFSFSELHSSAYAYPSSLYPTAAEVPADVAMVVQMRISGRGRFMAQHAKAHEQELVALPGMRLRVTAKRTAVEEIEAKATWDPDVRKGFVRRTVIDAVIEPDPALSPAAREAAERASREAAESAARESAQAALRPTRTAAAGREADVPTIPDDWRAHSRYTDPEDRAYDTWTRMISKLGFDPDDLVDKDLQTMRIGPKIRQEVLRAGREGRSFDGTPQFKRLLDDFDETAREFRLPSGGMARGLRNLDADDPVLALRVGDEITSVLPDSWTLDESVAYVGKPSESVVFRVAGGEKVRAVPNPDTFEDLQEMIVPAGQRMRVVSRSVDDDGLLRIDVDFVDDASAAAAVAARESAEAAAREAAEAAARETAEAAARAARESAAAAREAAETAREAAEATIGDPTQALARAEAAEVAARSAAEATARESAEAAAAAREARASTTAWSRANPGHTQAEFNAAARRIEGPSQKAWKSARRAAREAEERLSTARRNAAEAAERATSESAEVALRPTQPAATREASEPVVDMPILSRPDVASETAETEWWRAWSSQGFEPTEYLDPSSDDLITMDTLATSDRRRAMARAAAEGRSPPPITDDELRVVEAIDRTSVSVRVAPGQPLSRGMVLDPEPETDWLAWWRQSGPAEAGDDFVFDTPTSTTVDPAYARSFTEGLYVADDPGGVTDQVSVMITYRDGTFRGRPVQAQDHSELEMVVAAGQRMRATSVTETVERADGYRRADHEAWMAAGMPEDDLPARISGWRKIIRIEADFIDG